MLPSWVERSLENMGVAGAIIFVLLMTVAGLVAYIKSMQTKADKVLGFRLAERDTLNKTLTDTAKVLADMLRVIEDRNDLTEEQARLIEKQSQAFEILRVTLAAQYDNMRDNHSAASMTIGAMAEAIRTLTSIVVENRSIAQGHVQNVQHALETLKTEFVAAVREASATQRRDIHELLGKSGHRRKKTP